MVEGLMLYIPNKGISYFTAANVQNFQKMMTPRIVIIPTPGLGQLIPLTEFAKQLVLHHNFCVTFLLPTDGSSTASQLSLLLTLPASISHLFLSPVNLSDLPLDTHIFTRIVLTLTRSIPALRDPLRQLSESTRLVAIVFDLFGPVALNLAGEFGVPGYIFFACSALNLCLNLCLPKLDQKHTCQYRHLPDPVQLFPGCVLVHGIDMIDPVQERRNEAYELVLDIAKRYKEAAGIMVNSFLDLEPAVFKALSENEGMAPLFPIGPLIQTGLIHAAAEPDQCLRWLDQQPSVSVLFVSFGSGGTLSSDQIIELAFGLEISRQRFIWVIRNPNDKDASAAYFNRQASNDPLQFLPDGFLERIRGLGLVVPLWAPQIQILNHSSTGGFFNALWVELNLGKHCWWYSSNCLATLCRATIECSRVERGF
ncbi:hypothetical protein Ancab_015428 [Ancistrocladus abbreviatus]